jgi:hypothetical protein
VIGHAEGSRTYLQEDARNITGDVIDTGDTGWFLPITYTQVFAPVFEELPMVLRSWDPEGGFEEMSKSLRGTAHERTKPFGITSN